MKKIIEFLSENPVQYLSTIGLDSKPKVRPFQFMLEEEGKIYFCTSNEKEIYNELKANPYVEISVSSPTFEWVRLSGKAVFSESDNIKNIIIESSDLVKSIYKTGDNPNFEIFYLHDAKAIMADFSGNPPKEYKF